MQRPLLRALFASAAVAAAISLGGCNPADVPTSGRALAPLSDRMIADIKSKNMDKESPILVRLFKEESELEVWKQTQDGSFALLKTYPICKWSGDLGPKKKEGDRQAPEGFYTITPGQMNPNSSYYLAFNTGFPNAYDRAMGYTGSELMVHGDCSSRGCYAMTDEQIQEIYALARESFFGGQKSFQLQAYPFRMTAMNMAKHRNNPNFTFWKMLKEGYDHFEATKIETKVAVCDRRYVFDPASPDGSTKPLAFNPRAACPAYQLDRNVADVVKEHRREEQTKMAQYIASGVSVVAFRHGMDGGQNPVFADKVKMEEQYDKSGKVVQVAVAPGALPKVANGPGAYNFKPQLVNVKLPSAAPLPKEGEAETQTASAGLFGLFGGGDNNTQVARTEPVEDTDAQTVGLRGSTTELQAKPKPAVYQTAATPKAPKPAAPAAAPKAVAAAEPASKPQAKPVQQARSEPAEPQVRTAFTAPPPPTASMLSGSQPVVPAGSFASRWSGLR